MLRKTPCNTLERAPTSLLVLALLFALVVALTACGGAYPELDGTDKAPPSTGALTVDQIAAPIPTDHTAGESKTKTIQPVICTPQCAV